MPEPLRVIFLDWGGVLWPSAVQRQPGERTSASKQAIEALNAVCADRGVAVVVSSTAREKGLDYCAGVLRQEGFTGRIVGCTPCLAAGSTLEGKEQSLRGVEILTWVQRSPWPIQGFCVLDDMAVGKAGNAAEERRIDINEWTGLMALHVDEIQAMLAQPLRAKS